MKILTINTHSLQEENYEQKLQWFIEGILKEKPDIIAMQEVNQTADAPLMEPELLAGQYPIPGALPVRRDNHAANVAHSAKEMSEKDMHFTISAEKEIDVLARAVKEILALSVNALDTQDIKVAKSVEPLEEAIDYLSDELMARHVKRLRRGECSIEVGFVLADLLNNYERVSDHCSNIAISAIQESQDVEAHHYMEALRSPDNPDFAKEVERYKSKYTLA